MFIDFRSVGRDWVPVHRRAIALDDGRLIFANDGLAVADEKFPCANPAQSSGLVTASVQGCERWKLGSDEGVRVGYAVDPSQH